MNLQSNDFELFGVPERFAQDRATLDQRWKDLQREAHPDRFTAQGAAAQRVAMQWSVRINEAYQRLKDPLRRAAYLCELHGERPCEEGQTAGSADFLVQQVLAYLGVHRLGYVPFVAISLLVTFGFAWLSWHGVEKWAMRLKNWGPGRGVRYWYDKVRTRFQRTGEAE